MNLGCFRHVLRALLILVAFCDAGYSFVLRVPEDYPGLLQAVDASASGDSIVVSPGQWTDQDTRFVSIGGSPPVWITSCAFLKGDLTIIGAQGAANTIVDGGGGNVQVLFWSNDLGRTVTLEGLTITGGGGLGIDAVRCGTLSIRSCRIRENVGTAVSSRAINFDEVNLKISDSEISFNSSPSEVAGIVGMRFDVCEILRCTFEGNEGRAVNVVDPTATIVISDCEFIGNRAVQAGAVVVGSGTTSPTTMVAIEENVFWANVSDGSGGAMSVGAAVGSIRFNTFAYDSALGLGNGGGVRLVRFAGDLSNNTFYACHSDNMGAAVVASNVTGGIVQQNIFSFSSGGEAVAGLPLSTFTGGCNLFYGNEGGDFYGTWGPMPNDVFADPQFCNAGEFDFTVSAESPCAPGMTPGCGAIGAWGVGCGGIAVEQTSWGQIKALYR